MSVRGFSLVELVLIIAVMGILLAIATQNWNAMQTKGAIESEIKMIQADLMELRLQALYQKRPRSAVINGLDFKVYSSTVTGVAPLQVKQLKFATVWDSGDTVSFDAQGLLDGVDHRYLCVVPSSNLSVINGAYVDSIDISQSRITLAKRTKGGCDSASIEQR